MIGELMRKRFDKVTTLEPERGRGAGPLATVRGAYCFRLIATAITALIFLFINAIPSNAIYLKRYQQDWALVAMNHLGGNLEQTQCWVELIWRESRFDPKAKNGSHYGLAQMRSEWYRDLKPRAQVKAHINYIKHRYNGSACKALDHNKTRGWH